MFEMLFPLTLVLGSLALFAAYAVRANLGPQSELQPWFEEPMVPKFCRMCILAGGLGIVWQQAGVEVFLLVLTFGLVAIALVDKFLLEPKREGAQSIYEFLTFSRETWVFILMLFVVRNFVVQHYRVPTGSLEPTVRPGDFLLVNQFSYGWHLPVLNTPIISWGKPKVGDIAVFRYPKDPLKTIYVKRVVGVPGDRVVYKDKILSINGEVMDQKFIDMEQSASNSWSNGLLSKREETLKGVKHQIYVKEDSYGFHDDIDVIVPEGTYFMMGDNRDNSQDSRFFGPVSEKLLVGRAMVVLFGWEGQWPTWKRTGLWL